MAQVVRLPVTDPGILLAGWAGMNAAARDHPGCYFGGSPLAHLSPSQSIHPDVGELGWRVHPPAGPVWGLQALHQLEACQRKPA